MVWQPEVEELKRRKELAQQMGGKEAVDRQHAHGKLTVRERISRLADPGSFREVGGLVGNAEYDGDRLVSFTPSNTLIGLCTLNGRRVVVSGGDFTIRGGAGEATPGNKNGYAEGMAIEWHLPFIRLLDAVGGSVRTFEHIGRTYVPGVPATSGAAVAAPRQQILDLVPVVSIALGSVAGAPAVQSCHAHFNIMVRKTTQVFVAGPAVVKAALGYDITKEDLGNEHIQAYESGVIDNVAETEDEAFAMARRFLSYLPGNVWEMPPHIKTADDPNRREERLLSVIPRNRRRGYNPYDILKYVLDRDSLFEISPYYGGARITALARVNGYPVGVMINNPLHGGGSLDVPAAEKVTRFVQLCDLFHLPIVYFCDEPGFMVGLESEKRGMVRVGARLSQITRSTRTPWATFIIRQCYGVAGAGHVRSSGMFMRNAWPSANWGSMHIEGGTRAAYRREIDEAPDPKAKIMEIEARLQALGSPFRTAEVFNVEDIIDPRDTRPALCFFIEAAQSVLKTQLGPNQTIGFRP